MPALSLGTNQKRLLIGPLVEPSCSCSGSTLIVSITPPCITRGANKDLKNLPDSFAGSRVPGLRALDRKSTRLNSSHGYISYAVFCLKKQQAHKCGSTFLPAVR